MVRGLLGEVATQAGALRMPGVTRGSKIQVGTLWPALGVAVLDENPPPQTLVFFMFTHCALEWSGDFRVKLLPKLVLSACQGRPEDRKFGWEHFGQHWEYQSLMTIHP